MPGHQAQLPPGKGGDQMARPAQVAQGTKNMALRPHNADRQQRPQAARPPIRPVVPGPSRQPARAPETPPETIRTGRETYTIISTLQAPRAAGGGMSLGVYSVRDSGNVRRVAKRLSTANTTQKSRAMAEVQALQQVKNAVRSHPNVNTIRESFFPEKAPNGIIILECCNGGSLADGIDSMRKNGSGVSDGFALHVMYDVAKGLMMLHHGIPDHTDVTSRVKNWNTICHLDIKPPNILLVHERNDRHPRIVIADFGCSVTKNDIVAGRESKIVQQSGTPGWFPPEEDRKGEEGAVGRYGKPTDIWQMGGVIQTLCLLLVQPQMHRIRMPCGEQRGQELNCFVAMCLSPDYKRRPTAVDVCAELRKEMVKRGMPV